MAINRLLEFSASLALFFLEASLFESLAERPTWIQGKCKRQLSLQIQLPVVTKTWNDLKPPKTIYNHLKKFNNHLQPSTTTSKTSLSSLPAVGTCLANIQAVKSRKRRSKEATDSVIINNVSVLPTKSQNILPEGN